MFGSLRVKFVVFFVGFMSASLLLLARLSVARQKDVGVDEVADGLCDLCFVHVTLFL